MKRLGRYVDRGVLRPGVKSFGASSDGGGGDGYSITELGRLWLERGADAAGLIVEPTRLGTLFEAFSARFGRGFLQRANEAVQCHRFGTYLACCTLCGAAAEAIILAVAINKSGNEAGTLATYRAANGRHKIVKTIVGQARQGIAGPFEAATALLSFWRDETAHGTATAIFSEIEAHEALARLLRFAQFTFDNWNELTGATV